MRIVFKIQRNCLSKLYKKLYIMWNLLQANRLYQLLIGDAVSEYRLFRNRLHSLKLLKADLYGETVCPACSRVC